MRIKLKTALDVRDGYGYVGQELALALQESGNSVWVEPITAWHSNEQLKPELRPLFKSIGTLDFELIIMYPVYSFGQIHKRAAILTMYEAHHCPPEWVKAINQLKLPVFAPSIFVQNMFIDSGVKVPVFHVPLGVDTHTYKLINRVLPEEKSFRFLSVGKMEPRKNIGVLVEAFQKAFSDENVELVIKTRERFLPSAVKIAAAKDPRIRIVEKTLTEDQLVTLFIGCHCFVYPSRGEGFSFPPRNAIATGMPTIVTDWSALAEIPGTIKIQPCSFSLMPPCGFSYGREKDMLMADISSDDLAEAMLYVYNNNEESCHLAREGREKLTTWKKSARAVVQTARSIR
jgi:glycosyltransferase involved in cell wall biosynthesis